MSGVPLIWRFAEKLEAEEMEIGMFYDREKHLNCINVAGANLPIIHAKGAGLGTRTITEVKREETDQDPSIIEAFYGTETVTKIRREDTDRD
jgi:hypothetical protein